MSDNQLAYQPRRLAKAGVCVSAVLRGASLLPAAALVAPVSSTAALVVDVPATGAGVAGSATPKTAVLGFSATPKPAHGDLAAAVMTIDARVWDRRPRRSPLAR